MGCAQPHVILTGQHLREALATPRPANAPPCACAVSSCTGWDSLPDARWPAGSMQRVASLRDIEVAEPSFEEHHPNGTRYDSAHAPISVAHFPYNRCDLWRCVPCGQHVLKYTEFGGYYVDQRVRLVNPDLVVE